MMDSPQKNLRDLAGQYLLGALTADEEEQFGRLLMKDENALREMTAEAKRDIALRHAIKMAVNATHPLPHSRFRALIGAAAAAALIVLCLFAFLSQPEPPEPVATDILRTPGGSTLTRDAHTELKDEKEPGNPVFTLSKGGVYCTTSDSEEITLRTPPARVVASEGSIFRTQLFEREKEMKKAKILTVALAVYLGTVTISNEFGMESAGPGEVVFAQEDAAPEKQVAKGNTEFALDLYGKLKDDKKGENIFFSPFSISSALAMTYAGARGKTAEQMADVLHFDDDQKLHPVFAALINKLDVGKQKGLELNIANALWGQQGYKFLDEFIALNNKNYGAGLKTVDFKDATEEARQTINKWVEKQTKDKIKDLFKPGVLKQNTQLVLTNAIYFKGNWAEQFDKNRTRDADFVVTAKEKVRVPMMVMTEKKFNYAKTKDLQILELPYIGNKVSMVVLLPRKVDGLADLEKALSPENLDKWLTGMRGTKLDVYLPKFKMTCEFDLKRTLEYMGMPDAFAPAKADFSGMIGRRELFIQAVVHKAFVDVNEEGTEAAAATGVCMANCALPRFRADHPFLFLIRDKATDSILFMGRVVNPAEGRTEKTPFILLAKGYSWKYEVEKQGRKNTGKIEIMEIGKDGSYKLKLTDIRGPEGDAWKVSGGFFVWEWKRGFEWKILKLGAKKGDEWHSTIERGRQGKIVMKSTVVDIEDVHTPAGNFTGCLKVRTVPEGGDEDEIAHMWFAKGVGLVKLEGLEGGQLDASWTLASFNDLSGVELKRMLEQADKAMKKQQSQEGPSSIEEKEKKESQ